MEDRLLPINALLGLLLPNDVVTPSLGNAGFELAGLEIPAGDPGGSVVIDAVLFHTETNHLILVEAKSGANVEEVQAIRYGRLRAQDVVRSAYVTLPARTPPTVEPAYICLAEHGGRVRLGLDKLGLSYPIMTVSDDSVALDSPSSMNSHLGRAFAQGPFMLAGTPPRLIPFDEDSDVEIIKRYVLAVLVEAMSQRLTQLTLSGLTERATWHYGLYGRRSQNQIKKKVSTAARQIAEAEDTNFEYVPATSTREGLVKILRTPEAKDPRGRTQAYRAVGRQGIMRKTGDTVPWHPDQLDLFAELDLGENGGGI